MADTCSIHPWPPVWSEGNSAEACLLPSWGPSISSWKNTVAANPLGHESFMLGRVVWGAATCSDCSFFYSPQSAMSSLCHYCDKAVNGCADSWRDKIRLLPSSTTATTKCAYYYAEERVHYKNLEYKKYFLHSADLQLTVWRLGTSYLKKTKNICAHCFVTRSKKADCKKRDLV